MGSILVTGGAGFIGSAFVKYVLANSKDRIVVYDALTYAGNLDNLAGLEAAYPDRYTFVRGDVCDAATVDRALGLYDDYWAIVHCAAESHVDRSIANPLAFVDTNVSGTATILEAARKIAGCRMLVMSTDEVYGDLGMDEPAFVENSPIRPSSPYSASKAAADLLALSYHRTYHMHVLITRCSNNYGGNQFPEKFLPVVIQSAMADRPIPVYGDGKQRRDWIFVDDHCSAVWKVLCEGRPGNVYNIGASCELANIELVKAVLEIMGKPLSLIQYVTDRPGHDRRYSVDATKIRNEFSWEPRTSFERGLQATIEWYTSNNAWIQRIQSGEYMRVNERLTHE